MVPQLVFSATLKLSGPSSTIEFPHSGARLSASCGGLDSTVTFLEPKRSLVRAHFRELANLKLNRDCDFARSTFLCHHHHVPFNAFHDIHDPP